MARTKDIIMISSDSCNTIISNINLYVDPEQDTGWTIAVHKRDKQATIRLSIKEAVRTIKFLQYLIDLQKKEEANENRSHH